MPRQRVPQSQARDFVAELERSGAREIRRGPTDLKGAVLVRWKHSAAEDAEFRAALRSYRGELALAAIAVAVVVAVVVLLTL